MSSGVRNLRAMFENQGAASSPEPRGRSPGDNPAADEEEQPSRPTPKVRASFISVVPTAVAQPDFGTPKGTPSNSTAAHRRESFSITQDNVAEIAELKKEVSEEKQEREKTASISETVPEQAVASRESSRSAPPIRNEPEGQMANLGSIMKGADFPESSATDVKKAPVEETPAPPPQTTQSHEDKPAAAVEAKADIPAQPQTPTKTAKKAVEDPKLDAPIEPIVPAKVEEKPAVSTKADTPKKPRKLAKTAEKAAVAAPKEPVAQPPPSPVKGDKSTHIVAKTETPAQPDASPKTEPKPEPEPAPELEQVATQADLTEVSQPPAETQEEPEVASSPDAPVPSQPSLEVDEKSVVAPIEDAPAATETPTAVEEEPVPAPVEEAPAVTETPATVEEEVAPVSSENAPALPQTPTETETEIQPAVAQTVDTPADNPDKPVTGAQEEVSLRPAAPTDEPTISGAQEPPTSTESSHVSSIPKFDTATPKAAEGKAKANGTPVARTKMEIKKPTAISTTKSPASKVAASKSPLPKSIPRTPTTPKPAAAAAAPAKPSPVAARTKPSIAKPVSVKPALAKPIAAKTEPKPTVAKEPAKAAPTKTSRASLRPGALSNATASTTSAATKTKIAAPENKKPLVAKPATTGTTSSASVGGFKKPAPKSPTRPVKLPSHLVAPTAASAAKHGDEQKITRKPSTATRPKTVLPGARPARASIAPTTTVPKRPDSRASTTSTAPKGDFLSRMMRPTAASASKTHDKPASPPRKATKAPVGVLEKGKKKIEEVAAKAKDAVTTNGHAAEEPKTGGEGAQAQSSEPVEAEPSASQESHKAATTAQEADSSVTDSHTPQLTNEPVH